MLLFPADRASRVRSVDDAVRFALDGARRAFDFGLDEMACHLVARPYRDVGSAGYALVTVVTPDAIELPMPTIRAARGVAVAIECEAAIWVVPGPARADGLIVTVERADATEQRHQANPDSRRPYILGPFRGTARRAVGQLSYVALPRNVIEYAERYGLLGDDAPFGPTATELERARAAIKGSDREQHARRSRDGTRWSPTT
jgi:hypothetical protein